jgi:putative membrane protein
MTMSLALLHTAARISWTDFSVHESTVVGIAGLAALYEYGARTAARGPRPAQRWCYYAALVVLFFSLNGPLHDLSDSFLFSAHMVQHLMLALVVAPLGVLGVPGEMLRPVLAVRGVRRVAAWLTRPVHCFAIFNLVMAGWHLPPLYNYALAHHPIHILEHLLMLAASVIMWWPILSPLPELPRLSYPGQMLYLVLLSVSMSIVSVYLVYADSVLYPMYASAPRVWRITPMGDQMLGGLIMWIPGGLFFGVIISVVFFRWNQRNGSDGQEAAQVDWAAAQG